MAAAVHEQHVDGELCRVTIVVSREVWDQIRDRFPVISENATTTDPGALQEAVRTVMARCEVRSDGLPARMQEALAMMSRGNSAPDVPLLAQMFGSRRTLYRHWRKHIPQIAPAEFIRLLRLEHAALVARRRHLRDAANAAGYPSLRALHRSRDRHRLQKRAKPPGE